MANEDASAPKAAELIQLLLRASHYIQQEFEAQLVALDMPVQLSGPRLRLLLTVWKSDTIRMNELAIKLGLKARTITEHVDSLESDGLITRIPDPKDRRATLLQLTEEALAHVSRVRYIQEQISERLLQSFSAVQSKDLYELLTLFFDGKEIDFVC